MELSPALEVNAAPIARGQLQLRFQGGSRVFPTTGTYNNEDSSILGSICVRALFPVPGYLHKLPDETFSKL